MKITHRHTIPFLLTATLIATVPLVKAEIQVNDSVTTGSLGSPNEESITKWPEEVQFSSTLLPNADAQTAGTILRNFSDKVLGRNGEEYAANSRVIGQTFHIPEDSTNQVLEKIFILGQAVLPGNAPMKFSARLVDLGESPSADEYDAGKNLFPENSTFEIATPTDRNGAQIVSFTFTGDHRITLKKGHSFAFEIISDEENKPGSSFTWLRSMGFDPNLPDSPVFFVPFTESSKSSDQRTGMKNRQTYIGIKTTPAK